MKTLNRWGMSMTKARRWVLLIVTLVLGFTPLVPATRANATNQFPELVSVLPNGQQLDTTIASLTLISNDGRYVAYESDSPTLVQLPGIYGVFVYDRVAHTTTLASVDNNGQQANGDIVGFTISGNGRYLAFETNAANLDPNAGAGFDKYSIYIRDLATNVTTLASLDNNGQRLYVRNDLLGQLSDDGSVLVFAGCGSICNDTTYIRDLNTGVTTDLSLTHAQNYKITGDGSKLLYWNNSDIQAHLYDRATATTTIPWYAATSPSFTGPQSTSSDGRYVLLYTFTCVFDGANGCLVLSDTVAHTTQELPIENFAAYGTLSSDGSKLAFLGATHGQWEDPRHTDTVSQTYTYDIATNQLRRVSLAADGSPADQYTDAPSLSGDGTVVTLITSAPNFGVTVGQQGFVVSATPESSDPTTSTINATADTNVRNGQDNRNYGASTLMRIQSSGNNRALVRFDQAALQAAIGSKTLTSAKLRLTITDNGNNWGQSGRTIDAHRLLSAWTEGNGTETVRGNGNGATWNCAIDSLIENQTKNCTGTTEWEMGQPNNTAAHPWAPTATATQTITNNQAGVVEFDVTSDVASFLAGTSTNNGWLIKKTNEGQNGMVSFGTKESASVPQLVVTYQ